MEGGIERRNTREKIKKGRKKIGKTDGKEVGAEDREQKLSQQDTWCILCSHQHLQNHMKSKKPQIQGAAKHSVVWGNAMKCLHCPDPQGLTCPIPPLTFLYPASVSLLAEEVESFPPAQGFH